MFIESHNILLFMVLTLNECLGGVINIEAYIISYEDPLFHVILLMVIT